MRQSNESFLAGLRALEIGDEKISFCGKLLADFGVEVIKIERPGGDNARNFAPFVGDSPSPERSLFWSAFNTSKRSITLDIETTDGRDIFKKLVKKADFVLESFAPGYLDSFGLGYSHLEKINSRIIVTSLTPFGQTGPYSTYKASDMAIWALGGQMYRMGDPDRAPLQFGFPQAYINASAEAAFGTLLAHYHRELHGEGQYVDVSAQQHTARVCGLPIVWWYARNVIMLRKGVGLFRVGGAQTTNIWRCKDGHVAFILHGGLVGAHDNKTLVEWMDSEGMAPDFLKAIDWKKFDVQHLNQQDYDHLEAPMKAFFMAHTKAEIREEAFKRDVTILPVATIQDVDTNPQLEAREFWQNVGYPELGISVKHPGKFVKTSGPQLKPLRRAPSIGEDNQAVYEAELGLSKAELRTLREAGAI